MNISVDVESHTSLSRSRVVLWLEDRLQLKPLFELLRNKTVPLHKHSVWYFFGGLTLFFFAIQIVTGMLLMLYYSPTPETANESVQYIVNQVPFGWLIRSVHSWSANLMIAMLLIHFFSTFFMKAYRSPREIVWCTGILLMFLILGFGFTGYLLPWDTTAYFATQIGTEIPRIVPVLGDLVVRILRGGDYIEAESMKRLFALHVVILPLMSLALIAVHLILNQAHGASIPFGVVVTKKPLPFFPNYLYRDAISWFSGLILLFGLCLIFPVHVGPKADPLASAPTGIKPEWYFLTLFQTFRMVPASILGLNGEMLVNLGVLVVGLLLFAIPYFDRNAEQRRGNHVITWIGVCAIIYIVVAITLAYSTT